MDSRITNRSVHPAALLDAPETQQTDPNAETEQTQTQTLEEEEEGEEQDPTYIPLRSITAIAAHIPFIEDAREKVTGEMQAMVLTGLSTLVRSSLLYFLCN
jgi:conserved oligomeric Golgi complex subunit 5